MKRKREDSPDLIIVGSNRVTNAREPNNYLSDRAGRESHKDIFNWSDVNSFDLTGEDNRLADVLSTMDFDLLDGEATKESKPLTCPDGLLDVVSSVFPDICPEYVSELYAEKAGVSAEPPQNEVIINTILEAPSYPTEGESKRRKLESETKKEIRWGVDDGIERDASYWNFAYALLKTEFPDVPRLHVRDTLTKRACLFDTYLELDESEAEYHMLEPKPYIRESQPRYYSESTRRKAENMFMKKFFREWRAAKSKRAERETKRRRKRKEKELEDANTALHLANGAFLECQCCYTETPVNRTVSCTGNDAHFFCKQCIKTNAETQIGLMRFELNCIDTSGCTALFPQKALERALGSAIMYKIASLQQRDEIEKVEIDGLEECPFCDYKEIYPPVEENREFICVKPGCKKKSCRLCREKSHIPVSCEEAKKDKSRLARHGIEEAMTEAVIRICPNSKCKTPMIKEDGCNKMTCSKCSKNMCYVCKADITNVGYDHFGEMKNGACPLSDTNTTNARHAAEATTARDKALEMALKANPEVNKKDLSVEVPTVRPANRHPVRPNWNMPQRGYAPPPGQIGHRRAIFAPERINPPGTIVPIPPINRPLPPAAVRTRQQPPPPPGVPIINPQPLFQQIMPGAAPTMRHAPARQVQTYAKVAQSGVPWNNFQQQPQQVYYAPVTNEHGHQGAVRVANAIPQGGTLVNGVPVQQMRPVMQPHPQHQQRRTNRRM